MVKIVFYYGFVFVAFRVLSPVKPILTNKLRTSIIVVNNFRGDIILTTTAPESLNFRMILRPTKPVHTTNLYDSDR